MTCDYMLPKAEAPLVFWGDPLPCCLLEEGHQGEHLILAATGGHAVFLPYTEPCGQDCECARDTSMINYECFTWGFVSDEEAAQMLADSKNKNPGH